MFGPARAESPAALLVHGFTGSPQGLRELGEYLGERGIAVTGIRLPGHGTTWRDLNTKSYTDWVDAVREGCESAGLGRRRVFIVALSFGCCTGARFRRTQSGPGCRHRDPRWFRSDERPRRFFAPVVKRMSASIPGIGNDIADPLGAEIAYDRFP